MTILLIIKRVIIIHVFLHLQFSILSLFAFVTSASLIPESRIGEEVRSWLTLNPDYKYLLRTNGIFHVSTFSS